MRIMFLPRFPGKIYYWRYVSVLVAHTDSTSSYLPIYNWKPIPYGFEIIHKCSVLMLRWVREPYTERVIMHNENMPIQIYWKFYHQKMKIFR